MAATMVSPLIVLLCLFIAHLVYTKTVEILIARRFARTRGCRKLKSAPQKDPFLGIDIFLETRIAVKEKKFLEYLVDRFTHVGPTFASNIMGDDLIFTNEPKNIQAMLATNFKDFDLGERRRQNWAKLLGEYGIFNADGAFWEHSRALVRPNFNRKQVADLRIFESHIQKLVSQLPGDGSSVNIQEYLFRLVCVFRVNACS
jgi:cytochrome P450